MATLTNTKIKDTYDGLLKTTNNEAIGASGVTLIEDGLGNASALSVGRVNNGVTITGNLAVDTNTLYVDAANNRVGVGTSSPAEQLHITGSGRFEGNTLNVGYGQSNAENYIQIGQNRTGNGYAYIDLIGDETYTDFGLRIFRNNTGANASSSIYHRGTGDFGLQATDLASIKFLTQSAERMRIDSSGNVGIGTSSPTSPIHLKPSSDSIDGGITWESQNGTHEWSIDANNAGDFRIYKGTTAIARFNSSGNFGIGTSNPDYPLVVSNSATATLVIKSGTNTSLSRLFFGDQADSAKGFLNYDHNTDNLSVGVNNAEIMRIDSSGRVGINTNSLSSMLNVAGDSTTPAIRVFNGGLSSPITSFSAAAALELISYQSIGGSPYTKTSALIANADSTVPSEMQFWTKANGSSSPTERMRIGSDGAVFMYDIIGFSGTNSDVRYDTASGQIYYLTSSERYKSEITSLEDSLGKVNALRPVRFKDNYSEQYTTGLIAEEVVDVIPEVVFKKEIEGYEEPQPEGVNYSDLTPFLIKAIQELSAKVAALESQLNA